MNIEKIIQIIRNIKEESAAPTITTMSTPSSPGFSSKSPAGGPTAGTDVIFDGRTAIMRRLSPEYRKSLLKTRKKS